VAGRGDAGTPPGDNGQVRWLCWYAASRWQHHCELVSRPEQLARVTQIAIQPALGRGGVGVVARPGARPSDEVVNIARSNLRNPPPMKAAAPRPQDSGPGSGCS
jgi:hypothetical protein